MYCTCISLSGNDISKPQMGSSNLPFATSLNQEICKWVAHPARLLIYTPRDVYDVGAGFD